ncbi:ATP-binding cassette domain-containing protein [Paenibacillus sanguinis]|uniref:ATP-binding cassette domain-containing protein n=1 Tax=Paenibacillus sanguinis TaxID=225906 RepID=UPI000365014C|nr:ATP-binding cassette domain-containing protein [Paenibacillus sanguinis]
MRKTGLAGLSMLLLLLALALLGPLLTPYSPFASVGDRLAPPSAAHWLGTNSLGQDMFSGLVHGARTSLLVGFAVSLLSTVLSALLGLAAGYWRRIDPLLNGLANLLLVLPSLLLILIVTSFTGGGTLQLIAALGLLTWPGYMRLIRASVLSLKEREFVKAAYLYNAGAGYIFLKHLLPFLKPLLAAKFILSFRMAILSEASLSFLGIGDPNRASWGKMLQEAFQANETWLTNVWSWTVLPPMIALLVATTSLALLAEGIHGRLKPIVQQREPDQAEMEEGWDNGTGAAADTARGLVARRLKVQLGGAVIVQPSSFILASGSVTALVGESGSGKTTLARALYGLLPRDAFTGEIIYLGDDGPSELRRWRDAAWVPQDPRASMNPLLKIGKQFDEVLNHKTPKEERRRQAEKALQEVQLGDEVLERYPHELSGGMLSRVAIALALLNQPSLLIADEPTAALDPIVGRETAELLLRKVREHQMILLLITHDWKLAAHAADRILWLEDGRLSEFQQGEQGIK